MTDLLSHVFIAYTVAQLLSWRWNWITAQYITLGMVGALIPEMVKIGILLPGRLMSQILDTPFSWGSLHTGGGTAISILIGVTLLSSDNRRRGGLVLALGATTHLFIDSMNRTPSGFAVQPFWPISQYHVPSPGLYLSTQAAPTIITAGIAALVWVINRYQMEGD